MPRLVLLGLLVAAGWASLGPAVAASLLCAGLVFGYGWPAWRRGAHSGAAGRSGEARVPHEKLSVGNQPATAALPSVLYRTGLWRVGSWLVRLLPVRALEALGGMLGLLYYATHPGARETVRDNLLPVVEGSQEKARASARRLFRNFGVKLAGLLLYESGAEVLPWYRQVEGWEAFQQAYDRKRGVLFVALHLGNWEIGGALLASRDVKLFVITQQEPDRELTHLRRAARQRWGVETIVIGHDAFAFVQVVKALQDGAAVALLVDRPPAATAVQVELFGRPFAASMAVAELARASGCAVLGSLIVQAPGGGYLARLMPEFKYDRQALGQRAARRQMTQDLLRTFEPEIRRFADQWYHFVPVWNSPAESESKQ